MSSLSAAGPRVRLAPPSVSNDAPDACFLSGGYGLTPDPWQADVLEDWLGRRADGSWAASRCGLAVPRQNGKNGVIEVRELFGMIVLGEKFLHTAHEVKTARKAFLRIASFFENERQYPELAALVKDIRKTNGQEAVILTNGGSVEFVARSKGSGRGFTVDVLVLDEAQDLQDEELEALKPTISAAPSGNPQTIMTGTPPDPDKGQTGEVFTRFRNGAQGAKRTAWTDFGCADGPLPDLDDRALWRATNPALGSRLQLDVITDEREDLSTAGFARERLGWWGDPKNSRSDAFGSGKYEACAIPDPGPKVDAIALAVSFKRDWSSIGAAGQVTVSREIDGETVEVDAIFGAAVDRREGTGWMVPEAWRLHQKYGVPIVVARSAKDLIPALEAVGFELGATLVKASTDDNQNACSQIYERVRAGTFAHAGHDELDNAVYGAHRKTQGNAWVWDPKNSETDVAMLEAVTLAAWQAALATPDYDVLDSVL